MRRRLVALWLDGGASYVLYSDSIDSDKCRYLFVGGEAAEFDSELQSSSLSAWPLTSEEHNCDDGERDENARHWYHYSRQQNTADAPVEQPSNELQVNNNNNNNNEALV